MEAHGSQCATGTEPRSPNDLACRHRPPRLRRAADLARHERRRRRAPSAFIVVALIILLALALPVARSTERHWYHLSRQALASWGLHARFRRDVRRLWFAALTLPFLWISGAIAATDAIAAITR